MQCIEMGNDKSNLMIKAEHKLSCVADLDASVKTIDNMKEYYKTKHRFFVVHDFIG